MFRTVSLFLFATTGAKTTKSFFIFLPVFQVARRNGKLKKSTLCANLHFQLLSPITPVTGGKSKIVKPDMFENTRTMEMGSHLLFCSHPSQRQHPVIFTRYSDHQIDASIQSLLSLKNQKSDPPMTPHMWAEQNLVLMNVSST